MTVRNFKRTPDIDHSLFFSFPQKSFKSYITFNNFRCFQFTSPLFSSPKLSEIVISKSSFRKFSNAQLFMNFNDQIYDTTESGKTYHECKIMTDISFIDCTFIEMISDTSNLIEASHNVHFDHCSFINSTNDQKALLYLKDSMNCIISNTQFMDNSLSKVIHSPQNLVNIIISHTNFSRNIITEGLLVLMCHTTCLQNLIIADNAAKTSSIKLQNERALLKENCVVDGVQLVRNTYSEDFCYDFQLNFQSYIMPNCTFNRISISNTITQTKYYHFFISQCKITLSLINCCFSNSENNIMIPNNIEMIWKNTEINQDCFDLNPKKVQYGIIGNDYVELEIPRRLLEFFDDN